MIRFVNFLLYSNIFIAVCAVAMTVQTMHIFRINWKTSPALLGLVFFSTLVIYALHRLVSLNKVDESLGVERFNVIRQYKKHIEVYALFSVLGGAICFLFLKLQTQMALVLPAILSLAYVIPFLGNKKLRLRDVHFVKIFLIAIVWAYVTVLLPFLEFGLWDGYDSVFILLERAIFIFLITLPFDIRDWEIDKHNGVLTLPAQIGVRNTLILASLGVLFWLLLVYFIYSLPIFVPLLISGLSTGFFICITPKQKHDYFFTALIDGTMIIQSLLVIGMNFK